MPFTASMRKPIDRSPPCLCRARRARVSRSASDSCGCRYAGRARRLPKSMWKKEISSARFYRRAGRSGGRDCRRRRRGLVIVDTQRTMARIAPDGRRGADSHVPAGSYNPILARGRIWVTRSEGSEIIAVDAASGAASLRSKQGRIRVLRQRRRHALDHDAQDAAVGSVLALLDAEVPMSGLSWLLNLNGEAMTTREYIEARGVDSNIRMHLDCWRANRNDRVIS